MEIKISELQALAENKKFIELREILIQMNEVDISEFLETLEIEKRVVIFRMLPKEISAEVFTCFDTDTQEHIINSITDNEIAEIVEDLFVDDAVDILEELPASIVKRVLKNANKDTRNLINQFLMYDENSTGSIMTAEFIDLKKYMTVEQAFERIRKKARDMETIYTCYVTDGNKKLEGVISVKTLILSDPQKKIEDIMEDDVISVMTGDDKEDTVIIFSKYGLLALPVVDHENRLVGIVTVDDAVDVINEEATEDFEKMAAMSPSDKPYLKTSVFSLAKNRIMWLLILMISAMVTGTVLQKYEHAFAAFPLLVTFIPMLTDTGGNAGSQSSTLIIRGMALSEVKISDIWRVIWKELRVSFLVGVVLSVVNYARLLIMYPGNEMVAFTVALSLFATVVIAKTVGCVLPMVAKVFKADPAIMAAPIITTLVDAFALVFYFSVAEKLLNI
ncbi:MAG: magnesium transporter [Proteocatella sp.]